MWRRRVFLSHQTLSAERRSPLMSKLRWVSSSVAETITQPLYQLSGHSRSDLCLLWLRNDTHAIIHNNLMYEMSFRVRSDVFIRCVCPHRVGHNEIIGVMRLGCNAEGLGRDHWNEMLAYPRKPIAHWHHLLESKKSEKEVGGGMWMIIDDKYVDSFPYWTPYFIYQASVHLLFHMKCQSETRD